MRFCTNKKLVIITATVLLLAVAVGTTIAFVFTNTDPVENAFTPSRVSCAILENNSETENTDHLVDKVVSKNNVMIKNTGDTDAYIRVAVVVTWQKPDGTVYALKPIAGSDYTKWTIGDDWIEYNNYYYYKKSVAPGEKTEVLIDSIQVLENATIPEGYFLSVEIVASAIQSSGIDGVASAQDAWENAVTSNN